jgi:hypothetical protein
MQMISFWFGGVMVVVVVALAIGILSTDMLSDRLYGNKRIFFVILLLAYAVYRSYRMYRVMKDSRRNES